MGPAWVAVHMSRRVRTEWQPSALPARHRSAQGSPPPPQTRTRGAHLLPHLSRRRRPGPPAAAARSGWRFNGAGACTAIPQLGEPKALAVALASPRACLKMYPTQVPAPPAARGGGLRGRAPRGALRVAGAHRAAAAAGPHRMCT